jgi:hypothetical protein
MNPAQKIVQRVIEMRSHYNEGLHDAYNKLASLTLADFVTLAEVPTAVWTDEPTEYGLAYSTPQNKCWDIFKRDQGAPGHRCDAVYDAVHDNGVTSASFPLLSQAKRYVEICIHLETIKRQLLAELTGAV